MDYLEALQRIAEEYGDGALINWQGRKFNLEEAIQEGRRFNRYMASQGHYFGFGDVKVWFDTSADCAKIQSSKTGTEIARVEY